MSPFSPDFRLPSLCPYAQGFCMAGHALILLAAEDMILRLASPSAEALLYLEHFAGSLSSSLVLLWLGVLGLDLCERLRRRKRRF